MLRQYGKGLRLNHLNADRLESGLQQNEMATADEVTTMTPEVAFECLLVSHDASVLRTLDKILRDFSIASNFCLNPLQAPHWLSIKHADLVVIDWEDESSPGLVQGIWSSTTQRRPTIVAISGSDKSIPGAHIMLRRPVTAESGRESLKLAYSRMLLDHRCHARYTLMKSVMAVNQHKRSISLTVIDIADGGVGISSTETIAEGDELAFRLMLPGATREIYIEARVIWTKEWGRAGCKFVRIPPVDVNILRDWLRESVRVKKPLIPV